MRLGYRLFVAVLGLSLMAASLMAPATPASAQSDADCGNENSMSGKSVPGVGICVYPGDPTPQRPIRLASFAQDRACCFWSRIRWQDDPHAESGKIFGRSPVQPHMAPIESKQLGVAFRSQSLRMGWQGEARVYHSPFDPNPPSAVFQGWSKYEPILNNDGTWPRWKVDRQGWNMFRFGNRGLYLTPGLYLVQLFDEHGNKVLEEVCPVDPPGDIMPSDIPMMLEPPKAQEVALSRFDQLLFRLFEL